jgi:hypothetical protein
MFCRFGHLKIYDGEISGIGDWSEKGPCGFPEFAISNTFIELSDSDSRHAVPLIWVNPTRNAETVLGSHVYVTYDSDATTNRWV